MFKFNSLLTSIFILSNFNPLHAMKRQDYNGDYSDEDALQQALLLSQYSASGMSEDEELALALALSARANVQAPVVQAPVVQAPVVPVAFRTAIVMEQPIAPALPGIAVQNIAPVQDVQQQQQIKQQAKLPEVAQAVPAHKAPVVIIEEEPEDLTRPRLSVNDLCGLRDAYVCLSDYFDQISSTLRGYQDDADAYAIMCDDSGVEFILMEINSRVIPNFDETEAKIRKLLSGDTAEALLEQIKASAINHANNAKGYKDAILKNTQGTEETRIGKAKEIQDKIHNFRTQTLEDLCRLTVLQPHLNAFLDKKFSNINKMEAFYQNRDEALAQEQQKIAAKKKREEEKKLREEEEKRRIEKEAREKIEGKISTVRWGAENALEMIKENIARSRGGFESVMYFTHPIYGCTNLLKATPARLTKDEKRLLQVQEVKAFLEKLPEKTPHFAPYIPLMRQSVKEMMELLNIKLHPAPLKTRQEVEGLIVKTINAPMDQAAKKALIECYTRGEYDEWNALIIPQGGYLLEVVNLIRSLVEARPQSQAFAILPTLLHTALTEQNDSCIFGLVGRTFQTYVSIAQALAEQAEKEKLNH